MQETNQIQITELAQYRKKKGLSQQQIADAIRLSRNAVKHLEEGRFEKIGAAPYLRGHIINYCKQLAIEPQQILDQLPSGLLQHQNVQRAKNLLPNNISQVKIKTGHFGRYLAGTGLLAILLFSVYFIWDKANPFQPLPDGDGTTLNQSSEQTITYSSILPPVNETLYKKTTQNNSSPQDNNGQSDVKAQADEATVSSQEANEGQAQTAENSEDTQTQMKNDAEASEENPQQPPKSLNDPAQTAKHKEATNEQLTTFKIEFDLIEKAWVSIKTDQGEKVIHDLIGPGKRTYQSDQAMSFKIGNAEQVSLSINGEEITLKPFTKKNVANFHWPPTES